MDLVNVKLNGSYELAKQFEDPEWLEKVRAVWPLTPAEKVERWMFPEGPCRVTLEEATELQQLGFKVELVPLPGAMLVKMQDRHKWEFGVEPSARDLIDGKAVQLAIPDLGLLRINEVKVCEDYCTNMLQDELDEGWRILAVCPPNAARRPDYILGRTK